MPPGTILPFTWIAQPEKAKSKKLIMSFINERRSIHLNPSIVEQLRL
jgi:hypothetical protein